MPPRDINAEVARYEGLVHKTAGLMYGQIEGEEYDDLMQMFRVKVWKAIVSFDSKKSKGMTQDNFVFSCLVNQKKDLARRRKKNLLFIEDVRGPDDNRAKQEGFDGQYLTVDEEAAFAEVEQEGVLIPSTLTDIEVRALCYLYFGYSHVEARRSLGLSPSEMERVVGSVRIKMSDWRPDLPDNVRLLPTRPALLPDAVVQLRRAA